MSAQHTPGPFTVAQTSHRGMAVVVGPDEEHIAYVTGETTAQQLRDARLFAAAPDLLEALQQAVRCLKGPEREAARAAIAKAGGAQ